VARRALFGGEEVLAVHEDRGATGEVRLVVAIGVAGRISAAIPSRMITFSRMSRTSWGLGILEVQKFYY